ncbi:MAG: type VI secretion system ATPase TssH [bacterium]
MLLVDIKPLLKRLNPYTTRALEGGIGLCLGRTHYEVTVEHLLAKLLEDPTSDVPLMLASAGVDVALLKRGIDQALEGFRTGNGGRPGLSPLLLELVQDAWLIASIERMERHVRSGAIFVALVAKPTFFGSGGYVDMLRSMTREAMLAKFAQATSGSIEESAGAVDSGGTGGGSAAGGAPSGESALARFCVDMTAKARAGGIDPVFGRDREIRQMVDILARRRKNNPIAVGDPGVGKTAVIEGLALRIVEGDVPDMLKDVTLLSLDMGLLEAGASVKGEFENRLKGVISEVKASVKPIIMFIDEAHTLVGAGGSGGSGDAANLLKPALARGELRTIAATTWSEYKKYFEKDPALARRFQLVKLDEPDVKTATIILRGLKDKYEEVHGVIVRDDAIAAAAEMSDRYINGRQLPDKAVDLLDTACARVKISLTCKPGQVEDIERRIQALEREKKALLRDQEQGNAIEPERFADLDATLPALVEQASKLTAEWQRERDAAQRVVQLRHEIREAAGDAAKVSELTAQMEAAGRELAHSRGEEPLVHIEVGPDVVARVVSDWTGIPLGKVLRDQAQSVLVMADVLKKRIKGQDHAMDAITEIIKTAKSGLKDPQQPMGVFLLVGPSGTGKTETALTVADLLFGDEKSTIIVNMSEFQEKHNVSRLIGSPPGYVGYGEGGMLTEAVRQRPYSVVLLDETEKAHLDVLNLFYQVFDKGMLSDGEGKEIDFSNTVMFLTSNLATDVITEMCADGERPPLEAVTAAVRPILNNHFKPALLARMTVIPYYILPKDALAGIVRLKLNKIVDRLFTNNRMRLTYTDAVVEAIADRCKEVETGARNIDFILRGTVMPQLSQEILSRMGDEGLPASVTLDVGADGNWTFAFPA